MLKGYEDVVWERLVRLYPEKRSTLARVETPTSLDNLEDALPEIGETHTARAPPNETNALWVEKNMKPTRRVLTRLLFCSFIWSHNTLIGSLNSPHFSLFSYALLRSFACTAHSLAP